MLAELVHSSFGSFLAVVLVGVALFYGFFSIAVALFEFLRWLAESKARERLWLSLVAVGLLGACASPDLPFNEPWRAWLRDQAERSGHVDWVRDQDARL